MHSKICNNGLRLCGQQRLHLLPLRQIQKRRAEDRPGLRRQAQRRPDPDIHLRRACTRCFKQDSYFDAVCHRVHLLRGGHPQLHHHPGENQQSQPVDQSDQQHRRLRLHLRQRRQYPLCHQGWGRDQGLYLRR